MDGILELLGSMQQKQPKYKDLVKVRRDINLYLQRKKVNTKAIFTGVVDWAEHFDSLHPRFLHGQAHMIDTSEGPSGSSVQHIKKMVLNLF